MQLSFKQKRRHNKQVLRATERTEREKTREKSKGARRDVKNALKKLW